MAHRTVPAAGGSRRGLSDGGLTPAFGIPTDPTSHARSPEPPTRPTALETPLPAWREPLSWQPTGENEVNEQSFHQRNQQESPSDAYRRALPPPRSLFPWEESSSVSNRKEKASKSEIKDSRPQTQLFSGRPFVLPGQKATGLQEIQEQDQQRLA